MLVYEDPMKDNGQVCKLAKTFIKNIINIPIQNIKIPIILDELEEIGTIPELQICYSGIYNNLDETSIVYKEYLQENKLSKKKEHKYINLPTSIMKQIINNDKDNEDFQIKKVNITVGKKEYHITKELISEANEVLNETAEKIFNASESVSQNELETKIYDESFMIEKFKNVLSNYLKNE